MRIVKHRGSSGSSSPFLVMPQFSCPVMSSSTYLEGTTYTHLVSIKLNFENSTILLCFSAGGCQWRLLRLVLTGTTSEIVAETDSSVSGTVRPTHSESRTLYQKAISLCYCCVGLQVSYLLWGILQEKIMTRYVFFFIVILIQTDNYSYYKIGSILMVIKLRDLLTHSFLCLSIAYWPFCSLVYICC